MATLISLVHEITDMDKFQEDAAVSRVLDDLWENYYQKSPLRSKTTFFKAIEGRDFNLTVNVLSALRAPEHKCLLKWILGEECQPSPDYNQSLSWNHSLKNGSVGIKSFLLFLVLAIFNIAFTPIYYILHSIIGFIACITFARPPRDFNLPLTLVGLSQSREMLELFQREGVNLYQEDEHQNTVFHHLAYFSKMHSKKAIRIFDLIVAVFHDSDIRRALKVEKHLGLDALEVAAGFGSLAFVCHVMESYQTTCTPLLRIINGKTIWGKENSASVHLREDLSVKNDMTNIVVVRYDVTKYEFGDCNQSSLLSLICDRSCSLQDVEVFREKTILCDWIKNKSQKHFVLQCLITGYHWVVTAVILAFMLVVGGDYIQVPLWMIYLEEMKKFVAELIANEPNITISESSSPLDVVMFCYSKQHFLHEEWGYLDWCSANVMQKINGMCETKISHKDLLSHTFLEHRLKDIFWSTILGEALFYICIIFLVFDVLQRLSFLMRALTKLRMSKSVSSIVKFLCIRPAPGSKFANSFGVLSLSLFLMHYPFVIRYNSELEYAYANYYGETGSLHDAIQVFVNLNQKVFIVQYMTMTALGMRFLLLLYSLRLLPGIGHFIITTFRMIATLGKFMLVCTCFLFTFASIFHFLLRDSKCPALKVTGYEDVLHSLSSTFLLMLGNQNFPDNSSNIALIFYYVCVIAGTIVLLNFIIAEMTMVVDYINDDVQKMIAYVSSHTNDALNAESLFNMVTLPFKWWVHKRKLQSVGFVVEENKTASKIGCCSEDYSVYVVVQHYEDNYGN